MGWLKNDDRFPEHRKIRRLNDGAYRLHHTALCACAKDETDGRITEADIEDMEHGRRLRKHVPALVKAGLWHEVQGGWEINDFLDYNPSHAQQDEKRRLARERQAKWRAARDGTSDPSVSHRDDDVTNASLTHTSHYPVPSRPVPSRPVPSLPISSALGGKSPKQRASNANPQACGREHDPADPCGACGAARKSAASNEAEAQRVKAASDRAAIRAAQAKRRAEDEAARAEAEADPERVAEAKARALAAVKEAS